jgi:signal transduction histidine kinase
VTGDEGRLGQVLANLVDNAIKVHRQRGGRGAGRKRRVKPDFLRRDTGIGIPEDRIDHLFDRFTQADASSTRPYGGTGLGLAIANGLVKLMGGDIKAANRAEGGSIFTFTLPC